MVDEKQRATAIRLRRVSVTSYAGQVLLDVPSFSVAVGERVGIIGATGSGKTLLASAMCGLVADMPAVHGTGQVAVLQSSCTPAATPAEGWEGQEGWLDVGGDEQAWLAVRGTRIVYMAQEAQAAFHPLTRVRRQLDWVCQERLRHADVAPATAGDECLVDRRGLISRRDQLWAQSGLLPEHLERFPHELSGGQAQRALLVMCALRTSAMIVCDEPVSALDRARRVRTLAAVDRLFATSVVISHDREALAGFATRYVTVHEGKIVDDRP
nr:ATP-binding cassette domain-containing protein [Alphaproteobacteria bacterium]